MKVHEVLLHEALCDYLTERPGLYLEETAAFLYDEFDISISPCSIKRTLSSHDWTKKKSQQKTNEQNPDLRDFCLTNYLISTSTACFMLMNLDVTNRQDLEEQLGLQLGWHRFKCQNPTGTGVIRYRLPIPQMVSFFLKYLQALLMQVC